MLNTRADKDDEQESEIIYINPHKDIWHYSVPLDHTKENQTASFKEIAAKALAAKIIDMIEPDFQEMQGFELMQFHVIVKKYHI